MKLCLGEHRDAHEILVGVVARLRAEGALSLLPWVLGAAALASFVIGDWRGAEALALESLALAEDVGQRALVTQPAVVLALVANAQGRTVDARTYLRQVETVMEAFGVEAMKTMGGWARGRIELEDGDYEAAVIALDATGRFSLERGLEEPAVALWAQDLAEAHARLGRLREAEATLKVLEAEAERTGRRIAHAGVARCRGLLADETEFEPHFERAMRWHDGVEYPFERARTQLYLGERLRRANRRIDARGPLHDALSIFNTLGAHRWIERATRELRATGERARRRIPEAVDQLTPQEMLVARLAADGATNREAAAALFVSPKTIDTHLGHIYRKLAVRSRVELARRLGDTSRKSQANT